MRNNRFQDLHALAVRENTVSSEAMILALMNGHRAPVAQLVEHRAAMREVVSSTPAGPTLRVFK